MLQSYLDIIFSINHIVVIGFPLNESKLSFYLVDVVDKRCLNGHIDFRKQTLILNQGILSKNERFIVDRINHRNNDCLQIQIYL